MEEYREHRLAGCGCHRVWKYLGIVLATLTGSFLAFYFATSCALNHLMSPAYAIGDMNRLNKSMMRDFDRIDRQFDKDFKNMRKMTFQHKSAIDFIKTPDAYKFIIDLTPFQGKTDDINVEVKNNQISISGEASSNTKNVETFTKMSQTYSLSKGANTDKMTKKTVDNKYIITIPIED